MNYTSVMRLISSAFLTICFCALNVAAQNQFGLFENTTPTIPTSEIAKAATAAVIRSDKLLDQNIFKFKDQYRFCSTQPFQEELLWANCSATLIAKDVVLTAGHCVHDLKDCANLSFTFDFKNSESVAIIRADQSKLFGCKKILYTSKPVPQTQLRDWALIQLTRPVTDREPIKLSEQAPVDEVVYTFGHPFGMSQKFSKGYISAADTPFNLNSKKSPFYKASLITPAGISGGGVYDSKMNLFGILVRGDAAYQSDDGKCIHPVECTSESCPWAEVQKLEIKKIQSILKKLN